MLENISIITILRMVQDEIMSQNFPSLKFQDGETWILNRPYLMGVMNFTEDSFFPGSRMFKEDTFVQNLEKMVDTVDILDLGAESTRPGSKEVDSKIELARLLPKLNYVKKKYPKLRISIDTYKAEVARECISCGADIINDVSAGEASQEKMLSVCADNRVPLILMHKKGVPKTMQNKVFYEDVVTEVYDYLQKRVTIAKGYGLCSKQLLIDVGIGFGKNLNHNLDLLRALPKFKKIGVGVLVGVSRKSMLKDITGQPVEKRMATSIAVHLAALTRFCHIVRCHDVEAMLDALKVYFSIIDYDGAFKH